MPEQSEGSKPGQRRVLREVVKVTELSVRWVAPSADCVLQFATRQRVPPMYFRTYNHHCPALLSGGNQSLTLCSSEGLSTYKVMGAPLLLAQSWKVL